MITCGFEEWAELPRLGLGSIRAKLDTGAQTSVLHATEVEEIEAGVVRFRAFSNLNESVICSARISDRRWVSDSSGHHTHRYVIQTRLKLGGLSWPIEVFLYNRERMRYRMLLGRSALKGRVLVNPAASFLMPHCSKMERISK